MHFPINEMIDVETDEIKLGKPPSFPSFGWDNEYGERTMNVPPFVASKHMITNGEFWHFVRDGGYRNQDYWCDDGWSWRMHRNMNLKSALRSKSILSLEEQQRWITNIATVSYPDRSRTS